MARAVKSTATGTNALLKVLLIPALAALNPRYVLGVGGRGFNWLMLTDAVSNGNRTEWSLIRSVIIQVCMYSSRVWLQTELDDTKSYNTNKS